MDGEPRRDGGTNRRIASWRSRCCLALLLFLFSHSTSSAFLLPLVCGPLYPVRPPLPQSSRSNCTSSAKIHLDLLPTGRSSILSHASLGVAGFTNCGRIWCADGATVPWKAVHVLCRRHSLCAQPISTGRQTDHQRFCVATVRAALLPHIISARVRE